MPLRFLLLQARDPDDPMGEHELQCFAERCGVSIDRVEIHDLIGGPPDTRAMQRCDALLIGSDSRSDTYPTMEIAEDQVQIEHEARVSKVSEEQLFYLCSRGLTEDEARLLIVNGFIEPFTKELPMEYAVELNRLIELEMEGSIG